MPLPQAKGAESGGAAQVDRELWACFGALLGEPDLWAIRREVAGVGPVEPRQIALFGVPGRGPPRLVTMMRVHEEDAPVVKDVLELHRAGGARHQPPAPAESYRVERPEEALA